MTLPVLKITVGRLWARQIRDFLKHAKFADDRIEWIETGGLIERAFSVRGPQDVLESILRDYQRWIAETEEC